MLDIGSTVGAINYLHGKLRRFMRPGRRHVAAIFKLGTAKVVYQPLGALESWRDPRVPLTRKSTWRWTQ